MPWEGVPGHPDDEGHNASGGFKSPAPISRVIVVGRPVVDGRPRQSNDFDAVANKKFQPRGNGPRQTSLLTLQKRAARQLEGINEEIKTGYRLHHEAAVGREGIREVPTAPFGKSMFVASDVFKPVDHHRFSASDDKGLMSCFVAKNCVSPSKGRLLPSSRAASTTESMFLSFCRLDPNEQIRSSPTAQRPASAGASRSPSGPFSLSSSGSTMHLPPSVARPGLGASLGSADASVSVRPPSSGSSSDKRLAINARPASAASMGPRPGSASSAHERRCFAMPAISLSLSLSLSLDAPQHQLPPALHDGAAYKHAPPQRKPQVEHCAPAAQVASPAMSLTVREGTSNGSPPTSACLAPGDQAPAERPDPRAEASSSYDDSMTEDDSSFSAAMSTDTGAGPSLPRKLRPDSRSPTAIRSYRPPQTQGSPGARDRERRWVPSANNLHVSPGRQPPVSLPRRPASAMARVPIHGVRSNVDAFSAAGLDSPSDLDTSHVRLAVCGKMNQPVTVRQRSATVMCVGPSGYKFWRSEGGAGGSLGGARGADLQEALGRLEVAKISLLR